MNSFSSESANVGSIELRRLEKERVLNYSRFLEPGRCHKKLEVLRCGYEKTLEVTGHYYFIFPYQLHAEYFSETVPRKIFFLE